MWTNNLTCFSCKLCMFFPFFTFTNMIYVYSTTMPCYSLKHFENTGTFINKETKQINLSTVINILFLCLFLFVIKLYQNVLLLFTTRNCFPSNDFFYHESLRTVNNSTHTSARPHTNQDKKLQLAMISFHWYTFDTQVLVLDLAIKGYFEYQC